jgi:hypothetical protein
MVSAEAVSCALSSRSGPCRTASRRTRALKDRRTNPRRAAALQTGTRERTYGRAIRTNPSLTPLPNEPDTGCSRTKTRAAVETKRTRASARPVQRVGAPCRGHGFPRSHGPREQKVNGELLMSHYRRPKTGRIRKGGLRANQGRSRTRTNPSLPRPKEPETRSRPANQCGRTNPSSQGSPNEPETRGRQPSLAEPDQPELHHCRTNPTSRTRPHQPLRPNEPDTRRGLLSRRSNETRAVTPGRAGGRIP